MAAEKMAIIATKGTLDMAYPPLILAFDGRRARLGRAGVLHLLRPAAAAQGSRAASTSARSPTRPCRCRCRCRSSWAALPGMEAMATKMMKAKMKSKGVASLLELRNCLHQVQRQVHRLPDDRRSVRLRQERLHRRHRVRRRRDLPQVRRRDQRLPVHLSGRRGDQAAVRRAPRRPTAARRGCPSARRPRRPGDARRPGPRDQVQHAGRPGRRSATAAPSRASVVAARAAGAARRRRARAAALRASRRRCVRRAHCTGPSACTAPADSRRTRAHSATRSRSALAKTQSPAEPAQALSVASVIASSQT